jgi:hypothetical protein
MGAFICFPCGTQYTPTAKPPDTGAICDEERQYVPPSWAGMDDAEAFEGP